MKVFVFLGPSLGLAEARTTLAATYLPPVGQGDVYRATKEKPFAIGIVDGYFERIPAVWHKEILWALSQGVHVFGAASMGALRAAELARFGMRGVGAIYDAFVSGELEDDDEVAVAHGDASTGYRGTSEAMVNIRATLRSAERAAVLNGHARQRLEATAKGLFYPDRTYPNLIARGIEDGIENCERDALRAFLATNRVDQKRADALALLVAVRHCCEAGEAPGPVPFSFAHTEAWDQVVDWAENQPPLTQGAEDGLPADLLAAEVRLSGARGRAVLAAALVRVVAGVFARRNGIGRRSERLAGVERSFLLTVGLGPNNRDAVVFERWLEEQGLTRESYRLFLEGQTELDWLQRRYCDEINHHVVDELRSIGSYVALSRRARVKRAALIRRGWSEPTLEDAGIGASALLSWYFEQRLGCPVPEDLDGFLPRMGLSDLSALQREALCEYLFSRLADEKHANSDHGVD